MQKRSENAESVAEHVERHARARPDRLALIARSGQAVTYAQLWTNVEQAAAVLRSAGVEPGDRVVLSAGGGDASFPTLYLAVHSIGAVAVPVDPKLPRARLAWTAEVTEAALVLSSEGSSVPRGRTYESLLESEPSPARPRAPAGSALADVLFTSGTTGAPKGVMLSHRAICSAAQNINAFIGTCPEDVEVVTLPLSHSFGLGRLRCNLVMGSTLVVVDGLSFPGLVFRALETHAASGLAAAPTGFDILLRGDSERLARYAKQLRYIEIGSAPMTVEKRQRLMALLPETRICMHYGLTEASRAAFIEFHADQGRLSSIGRSSPNVQIAIWDEHGRESPTGDLGRIMIKGGIVTDGYWRDEEATRAAFHGGWFDTGDLGRRDQDGYLYLEGRDKEMINVGGLKVSPVEVEGHLAKVPGITGCACVGVPDPAGITGEAVWAYYTSDVEVSEDTLLGALEHVLEPHQIPTRFARVDSLPTTEMGKVQRLELKRRAQDRHSGQ